ncbi:MAG: hypothetical protein O3A20_02110 [Planctomycetota bacterium]|nr:hypothetical protein [Planctomycetota bacterium]
MNDSAADLVFLCASTMHEPDITFYLESGNIGLFPAAAPGATPPPDQPRQFLRGDAEIGYWEGEEGAASPS